MSSPTCESFGNKFKKQKSENRSPYDIPMQLAERESLEYIDSKSNSEYSNNSVNDHQIIHWSSANDLKTNSIALNPEVKEKIQKLQAQYNCAITQNKWHRKFGPPEGWCGPVPQKGCELFVGKIPRDVFEDELIPVLQKAGTVYELRLMMDTNGYNRGFSYVKYSTRTEAEKAVNLLDNYEIRPNNFLGVMKSVDNNRLFIGGIPKNRKREELYDEMRRLTENVVDVILYADIGDRTKNRGFAFVEYKNHASAFSARQKLLKSPPCLWGSAIVKIDWAEPEREVDEEIMNTVRILYVRNLALSTSEQQLREIFSKFGALERVKKIKDYAFIHFSSRENAEEAKLKLQGNILDDCEMDISWSKPVTNRDEYIQRKEASKALSASSLTPNGQLTHAVFGINGEPLIFNQKVRTAAGAQGYITPRPYPMRSPKQHEDPFGMSPLSPLALHPQAMTYLGEPTILRSSLEQHVSVFPQPTLTHDKINAMEEYIQTSQHEFQYNIGSRFLPASPAPFTQMVPPLPMGWNSQQYIPTHSHGVPTIIAPPYMVPAPAYSSLTGSVGNTFFSAQVIPNFAGPVMGFERT